jgi:hypothetical protein
VQAQLLHAGCRNAAGRSRRADVMRLRARGVLLLLVLLALPQLRAIVRRRFVKELVLTEPARGPSPPPPPAPPPAPPPWPQQARQQQPLVVAAAASTAPSPLTQRGHGRPPHSAAAAATNFVADLETWPPRPGPGCQR